MKHFVEGLPIEIVEEVVQQEQPTPPTIDNVDELKEASLSVIDVDVSAFCCLCGDLDPCVTVKVMDGDNLVDLHAACCTHSVTSILYSYRTSSKEYTFTYTNVSLSENEFMWYVSQVYNIFSPKQGRF